jgi:tetratricopeptide (TPR) repeat protein
MASHHEAWLEGMMALADPTDEALSSAIAGVEKVLEADGSLIAYRRLLVALRMHAGESELALEELDKTREQSFTHKGLAADEALYNAALRQRLGGVASVSEQLLADETGLSPRDHAHALLARAVVHVQSGELEQGLASLDEAWPGLAAWDSLSRNLALELAMEAHDSERARAWAKEAGLPEVELELYEAWALLSEGDVMGSLEHLAALPQDHPRVAYLQGLALVEQGRWAEAGPWLERADKLLPGRVELEVARARVELRTGEPEAALRKLKGLAEEEPYAPRAWTGLGEAHLEAKPDAPDFDEAQRAFERALEREHKPAEAMLRLAEIWDARAEKDPSAPQKARELLEQAAKTNDRLPRYRERLATYLAKVGYRQRAVEMLKEVIELPGVEKDTVLVLVHMAIDEAAAHDREAPADLDAWLEKAAELGATEDEIGRERARAAVLCGERAEAEEAHATLSRILESNDADVDARVLYSRALQRMHDREKAVAALRRGLQLVPKDRQGPFYLEWARIESRSGGRRKASAHGRVGWTRTLSGEHEPADLLYAADLATDMFIRDRKPKPAVSIARKLTELVPYHARSWVIRGRAELAARKTKEALESAEKALELDDEDAAAHGLMGDVVMRFGQKDRAKAAYERAVELAAGSGDEGEYKDRLRKL